MKETKYLGMVMDENLTFKNHTVTWGYFDQNFPKRFIYSYIPLAVAVSRSELKPKQTFTIMHEKFSLCSHMVLE